MKLHFKNRNAKNAMCLCGGRRPLDAHVFGSVAPGPPTVRVTSTAESTTFPKLSLAMRLKRYSEHFSVRKGERRFRSELVFNLFEVERAVSWLGPK